jgi:hypothetical protein
VNSRVGKRGILVQLLDSGSDSRELEDLGSGEVQRDRSTCPRLMVERVDACRPRTRVYWSE